MTRSPIELFWTAKNGNKNWHCRVKSGHLLSDYRQKCVNAISCQHLPKVAKALRQIYQCVRIGGWEWGGKPILAMPGFWKRLFLKFLPKSCQRMPNVAKHWLHSAPWFHLAPTWLHLAPLGQFAWGWLPIKQLRKHLKVDGLDWTDGTGSLNHLPTRALLTERC